MKRRIIINSFSKSVASTLKACYGQSGFMSFFIGNGFKIMGVIEYETS